MQAFSLIYFWQRLSVVDGHRVPLQPLLHLGRKLALFAPPAVAGLLCLFAPCRAFAGGHGARFTGAVQISSAVRSRTS
jgi:hypothetical protein